MLLGKGISPKLQMDIMGAYSSFLLINWGLCPKSPPPKEQLLLPHHNFFETLFIPQKREVSAIISFWFPFIVLYTRKFNFGQSTWDKSVVLLGTHWKYDGNKKIPSSPSSPNPQKPKKKAWVRVKPFNPKLCTLQS